MSEVKRPITPAASLKPSAIRAENSRASNTRVFGKVTRSFTLPQEVDEAKAAAKYHDGVVELTLPKKEAAARKQISIQ